MPILFWFVAGGLSALLYNKHKKNQEEKERRKREDEGLRQ